MGGLAHDGSTSGLLVSLGIKFGAAGGLLVINDGLIYA
jgi:hypothetical protein